MRGLNVNSGGREKNNQELYHESPAICDPLEFCACVVSSVI